MVRYVTHAAPMLHATAWLDASSPSHASCQPGATDTTTLNFSAAPKFRKSKWMVRKPSVHLGQVVFGSVTMASTTATSTSSIVGTGSRGTEEESRGGDACTKDQVSTSGGSGPHDSLQLLPIGTTRGKSLMHYVWDGKKIVAVDEIVLKTGLHGTGKIVQWFSTLQDRVHRAFFPSHKDVTPDYWEWLRWRLTQRFFSSTTQNLSTQSLLMALGMGAKKTIAASAAINWLLKDGVGRIARMVVATQYGRSFDSDLKRIRVFTSFIFEATIGCEFITPFFPQHFLALASISNIGKAVALSAFVATQPAFQQALCIGGNLADVTAKGQALHMTVDMVALAVSAAFIHLVGSDPRRRMLFPLIVFPILGAGDLFAVYREVKSVHLKSLNRERAEMAIDEWLTSGHLPNPEGIAKKEHLLLPPDVADGFLPLSIVPVHELLSHPDDLPPLLARYKNSPYMVKLMPPDEGHKEGDGKWPWSRESGARILVSFSEKAGVVDMLQALLEAAYTRQSLRQKVTAKMPDERVDLASVLSWTSLCTHLTSKDIDVSISDAQKRAKKEAPKLNNGLLQEGWKVDRILLNNKERSLYRKLE